MNNNLSFSKKIKLNKLETYLFYFIIIDILFLPYFKYFVIPYSLPIITLWMLFSFDRIFNKIKSTLDFKLFTCLVIFSLLSTIISYLYVPQFIDGYNVWNENFKRVFQFLTSFIYFFFAKYYTEKNNISLKNFLLIFILFADIMALFNLFSLNTYLTIRNLWNIRDPFLSYYNPGESLYYRYAFIWIDPNNAGYALISTILFLILNEKLSIFQIQFTLLSVALIIIATMSAGVFYSVLISFLVLSLLTFFRSKKVNTKRKIKKVSIIVLILSLVIFFLFSSMIIELLKTDIVNISLERIIYNSPTHRLSLYKELLVKKSLFSFLFLGQGWCLIIDGRIRAAHNGHFIVAYGYGLISYICFMLILFRRRNNINLMNYIFTIPFLIGFTINSLIGEQKIFVLYLILLVIAIKNHNLDLPQLKS